VSRGKLFKLVMNQTPKAKQKKSQTGKFMEDNMEKAELKLKPLRKNNINKFVTIILFNILGYLSLCL